MTRPAGVARTSGTDNYPTPEWGTRALILRHRFRGSILEPASGTGSMLRVLQEVGPTTGSDLRTGPEIRGEGGVDFLGDRYGPDSFDNVITNPPFRLAEQFAQRALGVARREVALLLRLQFLEGQRRSEWLSASPLEWVMPFASRLTMWPEGAPAPEYAQRGGTCAYAWFVWRHGYKGPPQIWWIRDRAPR